MRLLGGCESAPANTNGTRITGSGGKLSSKETAGKAEWKGQPPACKGDIHLGYQVILCWIDLQNLLSCSQHIPLHRIALRGRGRTGKGGVRAGCAAVGVRM